MKAVFNIDKYIQKDLTGKLNYPNIFKTDCIGYDSLFYFLLHVFTWDGAEANPCHRLCVEVRGQESVLSFHLVGHRS